MKEEELLPPPVPGSPRRRRRPLLVTGAVSGLVLVGLGVYLLRSPETPAIGPVEPAPGKVAAPAKSGTPAPAPAVPAKPVEAPKAGPTPSATLNALAAAPGQAVAKAQAVVTARRQLENDRVAALAQGEEPGDQRAIQPKAPAIPAAKPATPKIAVTSTAQVAPGVTATMKNAEVMGVGSASFQAWVASVRINGVFNGQPPRALINGRTVRAGQVADDALGIVFDSIDPGARIITFRDRTGAKVSRHYDLGR